MTLNHYSLLYSYDFFFTSWKLIIINLTPSYTHTSSSTPPRGLRGMWFDWAADKRDESAGGTEQTHLSFLLVFSPALTPLLLRCSLMLPLFFLPRAPHLSGDGWVQLGAETLMRERERLLYLW